MTASEPKADVGATEEGAPGRPLAAMRSSLVSYWVDAESYQRLAYFVGAVLIASGALHVLVFAIDGGRWAGPVSWRKPIVFGFSFGVTYITLAWVMTFLPRRPRVGWALMGLFGVAAVLEVVLISMQRWRGVASHFNESTGFDGAVFSMMGTAVVVVGIVVLALTGWSLTSLTAPPSFALAIRVGLVMLAVSQLLGALIIVNGQGVVDPVLEGSREPSIWGAAGVMKLPHALTIHAVQVLPALAWLASFTRWSEERRLGMVRLAALGYVGLALVSVYQTFSGLWPFDLAALALLALGASVIAVGAAFAVTLRALARVLRRPAL